MRLAQLQSAFQARVLERAAGIEGELAAAQAADFEARLGAYVNGYRSRLIEALATTYPALRTTLGEQAFEAQLQAYVDATPSRHYSVRYYGAELGPWLARQPALPEAAALAELAAFEWSLAEVFDATDDAPLALEALAAVPGEAWAGVVFSFRASVRRFSSTTRAVGLWRAAQASAPSDAATEPAAPVEWVLWRRGLTTQFRSLEPLEAGVLDAALGGTSFGGLCEYLAQSVEDTEVALRAATLLRGWLAEELIAGYRLADPPA